MCYSQYPLDFSSEKSPSNKYLYGFRYYSSTGYKFIQHRPTLGQLGPKTLHLALGREFVTRRTLGMTTSRSMGTVVIYLFCWYHQSTSVNVLRLLVVLLAYSAFFRSFGFVYRLLAWLVSELREVKRDVE